MGPNPDFKDLFAAFNDAEVRYLVVGAYAVAFHARPKDLDDLAALGADAEG